MFGYTVPIESMLSPRDRICYRNYYCETCHLLREGYGLIPTLAVNYEMTFAALFFNSLLDEGEHLTFAPKKHFCILRHSASNSKMMRDLTAYTVLVAGNDLLDDRVDDGPSLKANMGLLGLNRAIAKARIEHPEYDAAIMSRYQQLRDAEREGGRDPTAMGELSAASMLDVLGMMLGERFNGKVRSLFKNLGIWVYVMDALEDLEEDFKSNAYNPFLADHFEFENRSDFIKDNMFPIGETMGGIIGNIQGAYASLRQDLRFNLPILDNIIYHGVPHSAQRIIRGDRNMGLSFANILSGRMNRGVPPSTI